MSQEKFLFVSIRNQALQVSIDACTLEDAVIQLRAYLHNDKETQNADINDWELTATTHEETLAKTQVCQILNLVVPNVRRLIRVHIDPIPDPNMVAQSLADFKAGREKAFAYLVGAVMKLTRGKASPQVVNDLLRKKMN